MLAMRRLMLEEHMVLLAEYTVLESKMLTLESIILWDLLNPNTILQVIMILEDTLERHELTETLEFLGNLIQERCKKDGDSKLLLKGLQLVQDKLSVK